jgi:hypothetical protein
MTIADLLQSPKFVVDTDGNHQAVQLDMVHWQALVKRLQVIEAWEENWEQSPPPHPKNQTQPAT